MKKTRILSLVLAVAMLCTVLSGCFGGKTVIKVGGNAISEELYGAALRYVDMLNYQQTYGFSMADMLDQEMTDGMTGADMIKENTDNFFVQYEVINLYAKEHGIEISEEEKLEISEAKKAQIEAAGGRKAFLESLAQEGINEDFYDYYIDGQQLMYKVYSEHFAPGCEFAPTTEEVIASLEGYVRVKHVLITATEGDADYEEKKAEAEKIAARAKAGEDFDALIAEVAESGDGDPGMETTPDGYIIDADGYLYDGTGQMIEEFTTASNALAQDEVSGVVPSSYGFHIIKRYPFDAAYITENLETYSGVAGSEALSEAFMAFMETVEIEYEEAYDELDVHKIFGVEKNSNAGEVEEHFEGDGHDHGTEDETSAEDEPVIEEGEAVAAE